MLSKRTEAARFALFLLDQLLLAAAFVAAFQLKVHLVLPDPELMASVYLRLYVATAPVVALVLSIGGFYRFKNEEFPPRRLLLRDLARGGFLCMASLILVGFVLKPLGPDGLPAPPYSRAVAFLYFGLATAALGVARKTLAFVHLRVRGEPHRLAKVVVFGMSDKILKLLGVFQRAAHMHVDIVGVAAEQVPRDVAPRLPDEQALDLLEQGRVDHVLVEADGLAPGRLEQVLSLADREGISVHITTSLFPSTNLVPSWERIGGIPVLGFVSAELPLGARILKRSFDVVVSGVGLVVALPLLLLVGLGVRLDSRGPVFFVQRRVGARGRTFPMFKFRTMRVDAEADGPAMAQENDSRCTAFGSFLRRWNLDELPQLLNVLLGHMSLVGPRPERPEFVPGFKQSIPRYAHKHWVKPGITGWAQVHGLRGAQTSLEERIEHDLYYIEHWSLMFDIRILVRTLLDGYVNAV